MDHEFLVALSLPQDRVARVNFALVMSFMAAKECCHYCLQPKLKISPITWAEDMGASRDRGLNPQFQAGSTRNGGHTTFQSLMSRTCLAMSLPCCEWDCGVSFQVLERLVQDIDMLYISWKMQTVSKKIPDSRAASVTLWQFMGLLETQPRNGNDSSPSAWENIIPGLCYLRGGQDCSETMNWRDAYSRCVNNESQFF